VLQAGSAANLIALLSGARQSAGYEHGRLRGLLTTAVPLLPGTPYRAAHLDLLRALGIDDINPRLRVLASDADRAAVDALLERLDLTGSGPLVALHPGSDWGCQMWGFQQWATVADHLKSRWHARLVITGVASELWIAEAIAAKMSRPVAIACGQTTLMQLAALIERLDLLAGVDSGPVALCVATGTPAVALDGLYYEFEQIPWGRFAGDEVVRNVVSRDDGRHAWFGQCRLATLRRSRHCVNPACIGQGVMGMIEPAAVIEAIDACLAARLALQTAD
jgi:ADP-heptose:LPS heptosyltransferase